ncbi:MAG: copper amine oxidase N-terminal domain-containing protein [Bacillota bacterium]|nr:copper amine oxidase N-terminal domain-containing protein [Bacillota bacterium]
MKKNILILALALTFAMVLAIPSFANGSDIYIAVDGDLVEFTDQAPYIDSNNRTLVPIRFVAEALGAKVGWDGDTRTVTIDQEAHKELPTAHIIVMIDQKDVKVNGKTCTMDTTAIIVPATARTMVPVRFISEYLGAYVDWDGDNRVVHVFTNGQNDNEKASVKKDIASHVSDGTPAAGKQWAYISAEKEAKVMALPVDIAGIPPLTTYDELNEAYAEYEFNYLVDNMPKLESNQIFYTSEKLLYQDCVGDYTAQGLLVTTNADGTVTEQVADISASFVGSKTPYVYMFIDAKLHI